MKVVLTLLLLIVAVWMDVTFCRISNRLIGIGLSLGFLMQVQQHGVRGIGIFIVDVSFPVILLYLLFLMRALGAGDIKLFSVISSIWNLKVVTVTMAAAFFAGAVLSLARLIYQHNLFSRLCVFRDYICKVLRTGNIEKYPRTFQGKQNIIHFSVAILIGFIIACEVVY